MITPSADSIRAKLSQLARTRGEDLQLLLLRYANERLLYRLCASPHGEQFVLKGAMLLTYWTQAPHRATRDLDLLGFGEPNGQRLHDIFRQVLAHQAEDGLAFDVSRLVVKPIREEQRYGGHRITVPCMLGRARIPVQIDVGFGDAVESKREQLSTLLDLPQPTMHVYPRVSVVAEKTEAMVQLGTFNSRMKDFYDVSVLADEFEFSGESTAEALRATFSRRQTQLPVTGLSPLFEALKVTPGKPEQWAGFLRKSVAQRQWTFEEALQRALKFIDPPLVAASTGTPFTLTWPAKGPWSCSTTSGRSTGTRSAR